LVWLIDVDERPAIRRSLPDLAAHPHATAILGRQNLRATETRGTEDLPTVRGFLVNSFVEETASTAITLMVNWTAGLDR